jgi:uncharacterized protein YegP (UPF0339 family)
MATDFREVLKTMKEEEQRLLKELAVVRDAIPAIQMMADRMNNPTLLGKYSAMGTKEAILQLLNEYKHTLSTAEISEALIEGGIRTTAVDFPASVSTTLSQLKTVGQVDRIEDRWMAVRSPKTGAHFELKSAANGQFMFNLKAGNGEIILTSETYKSKDSALNGIESVKRNSSLDEHFERKKSTSSQPYFILKAKNHEVIGRSEMYSSEGTLEKGIDSVKKNGPIAIVTDIS